MGRITDLHHVSPDSPGPSASTATGLVQDVMDNLGIPPSLDLKKAVTEMLAQPPEKFKGQSRELSRDERKGVWVLLGLLAGSWVAGGVLGSSS